ncbi:hypothetical protein ACFPOE_21795 [Caenimonas terrae]|uniref:LPXTG cell wall anchor domain-containing protein n=1 Tax=Caenimonas terrae TaxID=696074 RepID=A0ABW0NHY1_9BURK
MSFTDMLQAFGLEIPSPPYIVGAILFGIVGLAAWRHGRRAKLPRPKWIGVALMFYPYVTPQTWLMYLVGAGLCVWLYFVWQ